MVIAPVMAFVMTALLLSCGSGSNNTTPVPTNTPTTLVAIRICGMQPLGMTPCPIATPVNVLLGGMGMELLWAQGQFSSNGVASFADISASATWFVDNSLLFSTGGGFFNAGQTKGCTCVTAASGTVISGSVLEGVGQDPSLCTPCPLSPGS